MSKRNENFQKCLKKKLQWPFLAAVQKVVKFSLYFQNELIVAKTIKMFYFCNLQVLA